MCLYERIHFPLCRHTETRLVQYCHFARNDPGHQCFGAWRYLKDYEQTESACDECTKRAPGFTPAHRMYGIPRGR
ncbi:unnamed protein product [Periconia digitata]|uniref:Uncharacterized protein n=1 Tax=Periconia digitata TaxID=1303443 RepID=A0A9W4U2D9_9PLEO|nr:unnamed protein product [Periconia digitata]